MPTLEELVDSIVASGSCELATAGAAAQLDAFERRSGFRLPADLRAFYLRVHRAELFGTYQLLPVELLLRTGHALRGPEWVESEPASWYAFCDVYDGNFVAIELEESAAGEHRILDCDHEEVSSRNVVATSFTEFLARAISGGESLYYLGLGPTPVVEVPYNPPRAWLQQQYDRWSKDPEVGPRVCREEGCGRLCVSLTVHCRRHHFEAIHRVPYPFDD